MTSSRGRVRIVLASERWTDRWLRLLSRFLRLEAPPVPRALASPEASPAPNVDLTLVHRLERRMVKEFVEGIEDYQLADHRGRAVHVVSAFRIPADDDLSRRVPRWLAARIRFGVVDDEGDRLRYLPIRAVDLEWDSTGTRMVLHLQTRLAAGTRATISGWLEPFAEPPEATLPPARPPARAHLAALDGLGPRRSPPRRRS